MNRPSVLFYQRRARPTGNYSLESIFADVRERLKDDIDAETCIAPACSNGLIRRLWIALHAWWHQRGVVHVTGDIHFAALLLKRRTTVLTIHDCADLVARDDWRSSLLKLFWFKLPVRSVARVTAVSESSKRDIIALTDCDANKIDVVPVAISERFVRAEKHFHQDCPTILQVGCASNKNIQRLAAALDGISCKLCVIGQLSDSQLNAIVEIGIEFETHQQLSDEEVVRLYMDCDIVAAVSTFEGFGMPIIEAQRVGRVVVTSDCSSMPEVAGEAACLVNPLDVQSIRDGIRRVIDDASYRDALITAGFENAKRFDPDRIANQYLQLYRDVLSDAMLASTARVDDASR